jgi:major inositol transporter-like SP family MFS transporter
MKFKRYPRRENRSRIPPHDRRTPWIRKLVFLGIANVFLSRTTGVNSIMYFASSVLISPGLDTQASLVATICNGVVSVLGSSTEVWAARRAR